MMDVTRNSLLLRARAGEADAWEDLIGLYRPLIVGWLNRQGVPARDLDDLTQDILLSVVKQISTFEHSGRRGAFRSWLRVIACRRTADYWRGADSGATPAGGSSAAVALGQVADPESDLNRRWGEEHDRYVVRCLLEMVEQEFEPATVRAFRRLALDGASGAEAAQELGLSVPAVYMAKSRVLQRIRQEADGLID